jgi:predicted amidohydrolase YtcJ
LVQSQGGLKFQPGGILRYFEDLKRELNTGFGIKDIFEIASKYHIENRMPDIDQINGNEIADRVFINGRIYTMDQNRSWAEALAVNNGRFIAVGSTSVVSEHIGPGTETIDLAGKMVLPGFIDSHAHVSGATNESASLEMFHLNSLDAYLDAVKNFAAQHPDMEVIYGGGWRNDLFPPQGPVKEDLDAIISDRPVSLMSEDGHFAWVNSMALAMAGVTKDTVSPKGGVIEKDVITGTPSGTIRETARDLIQNVLPPFSVDQIKGSIRNFMTEAGRVGITTAHDPLMILPDARGQLNGFGASRHNIQAYSEMAQDGELTIRIRGTVLTDPTAQANQVQSIGSACAQQTHPLFQMTGIKVFVDGVVEGGTAFLLEPYAHMPHTCSEPLWEPETLKDLFAAADHEKLQIHIHAIGDAAVGMALDALEHARAKNRNRDSRHLITHLHIVERSDIPRMAALDIIGVPQPFWHVKGSYFRDIEAKYLGYDRAEHGYPMQSLAKAGILLASASDYPVQVPSPPLLGIMLGVTRCEPGETNPDEILDPQECMTLEDMIASFTINGAYANFLEHETGSIEIGKKADMVVLENNLFEIPIFEIADTKILMTMFEGQTVYRDASL